MMERQVLAAASFYSQSYFFNDLEFASLPRSIQEDIKILLVDSCEYTRGVMALGFTQNGETFLEASHSADDFEYDEIGAKYHVNSIIKQEEEMLQSLSLWYNLVIKGNQG
ncbi:MAG: DUF6145 family protein [Defluviitaleaceae bacterium]|nr:DUF6145 family protein [Defluviitaleaceae bacterium]